MEQPQESIDQSSRENIFEPFPKPNTIPDGWDLSAITPIVGTNVDSLEKQKALNLD